MVIPAGPILDDAPHPMSDGRDDNHHHDQRRNADQAKLEEMGLAEEPGAHAVENDRQRI